MRIPAEAVEKMIHDFLSVVTASDIGKKYIYFFHVECRNLVQLEKSYDLVGIFKFLKGGLKVKFVWYYDRFTFLEIVLTNQDVPA